MDFLGSLHENLDKFFFCKMREIIALSHGVVMKDKLYSSS